MAVLAHCYCAICCAARFRAPTINPAVAAHGGNVKLVEVQDGNVMLQFGGGCHGCSSSSLTLKQGIEVKLREKFPEIGQIVDVTDHSTGANPYYAH